MRVARPQIARYAERYCIAQLAEDATQEALWTLYQKLPTLRAVAAFPVWLLRIVARICSGLVSPLWRRVEALQEEHWAAQPEDIELRLDLANAIEALPETYREALRSFIIAIFRSPKPPAASASPIPPPGCGFIAGASSSAFN